MIRWTKQQMMMTVKNEKIGDIDSEEETKAYANDDDDIEEAGWADMHMTGEEDDEDLGDITAESCIPTYTLKQLFFQEVEHLYNSGKLVDRCDQKQDKHMIKSIVYNVYSNLLAGIEKEFVSSYFIPGHNIYSKGSRCVNVKQAEEVKYKFIKGIVGVLKSAGFEK